jgi:RNA polymerase sigma-70 factor (ECF subfamily)
MDEIDTVALELPSGHAERAAGAVSDPRNAGYELPKSEPRAGLEPAIESALVAAIPRLRAFALSLSRNADRAEDLVQDTLLRACTHIAQFRPGTNLVAWLMTILRNEFFSEQRRRRREVEDADGSYAETLVTRPEQLALTDQLELNVALATLPHEMRDAIVLVGAQELSYAEAAEACGCAVGTIKSRVHRARMRLSSTLSLSASSDLFDDPIYRSVAVQAEQGRSRRVA